MIIIVFITLFGKNIVLFFYYIMSHTKRIAFAILYVSWRMEMVNISMLLDGGDNSG